MTKELLKRFAFAASRLPSSTVQVKPIVEVNIYVAYGSVQPVAARVCVVCVHKFSAAGVHWGVHGQDLRVEAWAGWLQGSYPGSYQLYPTYNRRARFEDLCRKQCRIYLNLGFC